jgi:hypothetical protein
VVPQLVNVDLTNHSGGDTSPAEASARRETLVRRKSQIEHQLAAFDAREQEAKRKRETRQKIIVGAAVLAHAQRDPSFAATLQSVLQRAVVRPKDRSFLALDRGSLKSAKAETTTRAQRAVKEHRPKSQRYSILRPSEIPT